ncbi:hypothetical protein WH47_02253, partial [Habropoda laboriosa]
LVAARGGSSRSLRRFDLSKVDSGKSRETSGACLPTGRTWRRKKEWGREEREER